MAIATPCFARHNASGSSSADVARNFPQPFKTRQTLDLSCALVRDRTCLSNQKQSQLLTAQILNRRSKFPIKKFKKSLVQEIFVDCHWTSFTFGWSGHRVFVRGPLFFHARPARQNRQANDHFGRSDVVNKQVAGRSVFNRKPLKAKAAPVKRNSWHHGSNFKASQYL